MFAMFSSESLATLPVAMLRLGVQSTAPAAALLASQTSMLKWAFAPTVVALRPAPVRAPSAKTVPEARAVAAKAKAPRGDERAAASKPAAKAQAARSAAEKTEVPKPAAKTARAAPSADTQAATPAPAKPAAKAPASARKAAAKPAAPEARAKRTKQADSQSPAPARPGAKSGARKAAPRKAEAPAAKDSAARQKVETTAYKPRSSAKGGSVTLSAMPAPDNKTENQ